MAETDPAVTVACNGGKRVGDDRLSGDRSDDTVNGSDGEGVVIGNPGKGARGVAVFDSGLDRFSACEILKRR